MHHHLKSISTFVFIALASPGSAQGVPTVDVASIAKITALIAEAEKQLQELIAQNLVLDEQTKQMLQQIALLQQQLDALRNGLDLSALGIGEDFLQNILPPDIRNVLQAVETGDFSGFLNHGEMTPSSAHLVLENFYESAGIDGGRVQELANSENTSDARIGVGAQTAAGLSVAAQASAEEASEGLERVDELVRKIPGTDNMKSAIDLNSRITAELAIALANIWSMEAAQTIGQGQMGVIDAATLAEDERFLDLSGGN